MNQALFKKVKDLTKDSGVSEKYLQEITEELGGDIADDSTDTEAIEKCANRIAKVVSCTQGEATRWAQRSKKGKKTTKSKQSDDDDDDDVDDDDDDDDEPDDDDDEGGRGKGKKKPAKTSKADERIKNLEKELKALKEEREGNKRRSEIDTLMEKHKIPAAYRSTLAKSIGSEDDAEKEITSFKQVLITSGLSEDSGEGAKGKASDKDVESAAEDLLKQIEVK